MPRSHDGRPFYINYNIENQNEAAQEIGQRDFAGLCRATCVLSPDDSQGLHFIKFRVKIGIKARQDTGETENVVREYLFDDWGAAEMKAPAKAANCNQSAPPAKKATASRK
ncbi:hypothetical protein OIU35_12590 [Boseaceae bacterium BT-24-1]|nr:hypothetical protein [Boseaceae bacterium BT-24-1]